MRALMWRLGAVFLFTACVRSTPPAPPPTPSEAECTLSTSLTPGVPGSPGHLITSAINPNGASELATLMRRMVKDWDSAKAALGKGVSLEARYPTHRKMRCAWPTDPSDRNASFDAMAVTYLEQVKAFDAAPSPATYANVLAGCQACHEQTCPGPLTVIEGLKGL